LCRVLYITEYSTRKESRNAMNLSHDEAQAALNDIHQATAQTTSHLINR
jgi:hypothetical protein